MPSFCRGSGTDVWLLCKGNFPERAKVINIPHIAYKSGGKGGKKNPIRIGSESFQFSSVVEQLAKVDLFFFDRIKEQKSCCCWSYFLL